MGSRGKLDPRATENDGASPGKIFIGGLAKDTTTATFLKHFGRYGEIIDSVIMKDRMTGRPRGFGFITYADPSVVDKVIEDEHVINGKPVEIKRTIPKGSSQSKDLKTKKIFVGGIPTTVTDEEFKDFFSKHGKVVEHQIIRDHLTNRSRGFGFIIFENEESVDNLLVNGKMIDFSGTKVEIKKAEPKKPPNPPSSGYARNYRPPSYDDRLSGYGGGGGGPGVYGPPRSVGLSGRLWGGYDEIGGGYGGFGSSLGSGGGEYGSFGRGDLGSYRGESSLGYTSHLGSYSGDYGGGGYGNLGGYGRNESNYDPTPGPSFRGGGYGSGSRYGVNYDPAPGPSFGSGGPYGGRGGGGGGVGGYGGSVGGGGGGGGGRYHPYGGR